MSSKSDYLFNLPNGTHLSYASPQCLSVYGGSQFKWGRSYYDYRIVHQEYKCKDKQFRLGLWSARGNQKFVCADFDTLPKGFSRWEKFWKYLKDKYPRDFVFRSASGKAKVLFLVQLRDGYINSKMARTILCGLLEPKVFDAVDTSTFGMSIAYTRPQMVSALRTWLETARPRKINVNKLYRKQSSHLFKQHEGFIPFQIRKAFIRGNKAKEILIRIIMRQRLMAMKKGFDFPTTKFAREIGVDQKTIHRWRNELIELGFIKCIDSKYKIHRKAMTFKSLGVLKVWIVKIFKNKVPNKLKGGKTTRHDLPTKIITGTWHQTIWEYSKYFIHDPDEFFNWVKSLPDSHLKNRTKKAYYAMVSRLKYAGLPYSHLVI